MILKVINGCTNKNFVELLFFFFNEMLQEGNILPKAKKIICLMGMKYKKNTCMY